MPKRLCSICARGGSKGVKNKNIRELQGKPLIAHSLVQAKESGLFDYIAVSSDSPAILEISQKWGADFAVQRPDDLASDTAAKLPAIQHCLRSVEDLTQVRIDEIVDLDATSPLRTVDDIRGALELMHTTKAFNVITGSPARRSPYFNLVEVDAKGDVHLSGMKNVGKQEDWHSTLLSIRATVRDAVETVDTSDLKIAFVVDDKKFLKGVVSERDLRLALLNRADLEAPVETIMNPNPTVASLHDNEVAIARLFENTQYKHIPIVDDDGHLVLAKMMEFPIIRRQDAPKCYDMNASIYVWSRESLFASEAVITAGTKLYIMPEERSLDIDSELDFQLVSFLMNQSSAG